jgi:hypothetical protein
MYIYTFLLRMTDPMTFQNTDLSVWDILYNKDSVPPSQKTCDVSLHYKDQPLDDGCFRT